MDKVDEGVDSGVWVGELEESLGARFVALVFAEEGEDGGETRGGYARQMSQACGRFMSMLQ